jgi:hypothetical protein
MMNSSLDAIVVPEYPILFGYQKQVARGSLAGIRAAWRNMRAISVRQTSFHDKAAYVRAALTVVTPD